MCDSKGRKQFLTDKNNDHTAISLDYDDDEWGYSELRISHGNEEIRLYVGDSEDEKKRGLEMVRVLREFLDEFEIAIKAEGKVSE